MQQQQQKRVSFSDIVSIRSIKAVTDPDLKSSLFYKASELRQFAYESDPEHDDRRRQRLATKTAQVRERTARILQRRRARQAALKQSAASTASRFAKTTLAATTTKTRSRRTL